MDSNLGIVPDRSGPSRPPLDWRRCRSRAGFAGPRPQSVGATRRQLGHAGAHGALVRWQNGQIQAWVRRGAASAAPCGTVPRAGAGRIGRGGLGRMEGEADIGRAAGGTKAGRSSGFGVPGPGPLGRVPIPSGTVSGREAADEIAGFPGPPIDHARDNRPVRSNKPRAALGSALAVEGWVGSTVRSLVGAGGEAMVIMGRRSFEESRGGATVSRYPVSSAFGPG